MPYGMNIATCMHCGRKLVVGDCILSTCPECYAVGHRNIGAGFGCPVCDAEMSRIRSRIEDSKKKAGAT